MEVGSNQLANFELTVMYSAIMDIVEVPEQVLQLTEWTESNFEFLNSITDVEENKEGL